MVGPLRKARLCLFGPPLVVLGLGVSACERPAEHAEAGAVCEPWVYEASATELRKGSEIWDVLCAACHGADATGGVRGRLPEISSPDLTDPARVALFSDEVRIEIIAEGVEGTTMVGWHDVLTEPEILAVYGHLCTLIEAAQGGPGR